MRRLDRELEQRVREHAAYLEATNPELEAFSYSVSHDLRTPLRAMAGFSRSLLEEYGSRLPDESRRYLQTIQDNAHQMGDLIDDLLFIVASANVDEDLGASAMKQGAADYFHKDRLARLEQAVAQALERKKQRREKQQAEDALRESEERFRATFEQVAVGMALVGLDGRWLLVNQRICDLVGYTRAEMLERTFPDITHPDDLADDLARLSQLVAGEIQSHSLEKRYIRRDGSHFWGNITRSLVRDAQGQPKYFISVVEDISEHKLAEAALRESEARFRSVIELAPTAVILADSGGQIILWNKGAQTIFGYAAAEILGQSLTDLMPERYREAHRRGLARFSASGEARAIGKTVELHGLKKDGSEFPLELSLTSWKTAHETFFCGIISDTSERKRAEVALRNSEERYRLLFESNPHPMWVYDRQTLGFLAVNDAAVRHYGYSREEFLSMTIKDIRPPDEVTALLDRIAGIPTKFDAGDTWRHCKKDGTLIEVEISSHALSFGASPARLVLAHDVTARKRAEEEQRRLQTGIEKSALEWQLTFDAIESPVLILDKAGRVTRLNAAAKKLAECNGAEMAGQGIADLGSCQPWRKATELINSICETRAAAACQARDEASGRTWDVAANLALGPEVDDERVILVMREITRLVELQASLHRSETMSLLGSLVSGVAHEVRNPLFGISSTLDAFEARFGAKEEYQRYLDVLHGEVDRLSNLMKDLLDYGRPLSPELCPGSVEDVIAKAVHACRPLAKRAEVKIVNQASAALSPIHIDQQRLPQVFLNLLENAIQHSPPGGVITVEAGEVWQDNQWWIVCAVKDTGPGIREDDLPHLFEPFFTRRRGGTGLGLSIVQRLVEAHGGEIFIGNRPESGASVVVRFPVVTDRQG